MKIIAIGDNVVDCYMDQMTYYPGGNCVNVLVNAKRLGAQAAEYIGVFATDDKADHIQEVLRKEEIEFGGSRIVHGISGQPRVNLTQAGDRVFVGSVKNTVQHNMKLRITPEDCQRAQAYDLCHTSCYSSIEEELPKLAKVVPVSFDFSDHRDPAYLEKVCPYVSYAFFSAAEMSECEIEAFLLQLVPYAIPMIGITRGSAPALFLKEGKRYLQEALPVDVVDTMGAGDSFIAGFLHAYVDGAGMEESLAAAAASAAKTCRFYGGFGYPKKLKY